jgi:hypothetical protein
MEVLKPLLHDLFFPLCITALWGIIFLVVYRVLSQESLFNCSTSKVLALCISILCILGLFKPFFNQGDGSTFYDKPDRDIVGIMLLIFGLLGIVLCISVVFYFAKRLFRKRESKEFPGEIEQRMESLYPFRYVNRR